MEIVSCFEIKKRYKKQRDCRRSRVRGRVEHVFGIMSKLAHESRMIFTKGLCRAEVKICLKNLMYDQCRVASLRQIWGNLCADLTKYGKFREIFHKIMTCDELNS